jgi:hypothetical protein
MESKKEKSISLEETLDLLGAKVREDVKVPVSPLDPIRFIAFSRRVVLRYILGKGEEL